MTRITSAVRIARPIEAVFAYATTPANWPSWHPASRAVSPNGDHPLEAGEEAVEEFVAAGRPGRATWRVVARREPKLWTIVAANEMGSASITYRLRPLAADATLFERDLAYRFSLLRWRVLDLLVLRRRMARESRDAVLNLKARLEVASEAEPAASVERHPRAAMTM